MKILNDYVFRKKGAIKTEKYPRFNDLADGQARELTRGEDFDASLKIQTVRTMLATYANRNEMKCRTNVIDDNTIVAQFYRPA